MFNNLPQPIVIGLTGHPGSGKDTIAQHLYTKYRFSQVSFVDPLKEAASLLFNIPVENFTSHDTKDRVAYMYGVTPREILLALGATVRELSSDALINTMRYRIHLLQHEWGRRLYTASNSRARIVVTDVRMPQEAALIRDLGGIIIGVRRTPQASIVPPNDYRNQPTEWYVEDCLASLPASQVLYNDQNIEHLFKQVDKLMSETSQV